MTVSSSMYDILVAGGAGVDTIVRVPELRVPPGDSVFVPPVRDYVAHTGNGVARGTHALGLTTKFIDFLGADAQGHQILAAYATSGLDFSHVVSPHGTPRGVNLVDAQGRRFSFYDGRHPADLRLPRAFYLPFLERARHVHLSITGVTLDMYADIHRLGVPCSTDLHDWDGANPHHLAYAVASDYVFMSAAAVHERLDEVLRSILDRGRARLVVATDGAARLPRPRTRRHERAALPRRTTGASRRGQQRRRGRVRERVPVRTRAGKAGGRLRARRIGVRSVRMHERGHAHRVHRPGRAAGGLCARRGRRLTTGTHDVHIITFSFECGGFDPRLMRGGLSPLVWQLSRRYAAHGHRVSLVTPGHGHVDRLRAAHGIEDLPHLTRTRTVPLALDPEVWASWPADLDVDVTTTVHRLRLDGVDVYFLSNAYLDLLPDRLYPPPGVEGRDLSHFKPLVFQAEGLRFVQEYLRSEDEPAVVHAFEPAYHYLLPRFSPPIHSSTRSAPSPRMPRSGRRCTGPR